MLRAEATPDGVTAVGSFRPSVVVDAPRWRHGDGPESSGNDAPELRGPVDDSATGRATVVRLPPGTVSLTRRDTATTRRLTDPESIPAGTYEVRVDSAVTVAVGFTAASGFSLDPTGGTLSFPTETAVRVGFAEATDEPPGRIAVRRTPEGVATALSTLSTANLTPTPARSHPRMRRHPPLIEFSDATEVPERFARRQTEGDVTLALPPDLDYLFPAASLVHYLGADVRLEPNVVPTLRTSAVEHRFEPMPGFQYEVASVLRRVFLMDCLVRGALPGNDRVAEHCLLERLDVDSDRLAAAAVDRRLEAYLGASFGLVSPRLPEWHLSMYVEPTYDHVRTLPHVLANLPNLFLPASRPLDSDERLSHSLDEFYRGTDDGRREVDPVKPLLGPGRAHGWLADGVPIDAFKTVPEAYDHRPQGGRDDRPTSVVAILNDVEMASEHDEAADIYRRGTVDLDIDLSVRERLTRAELAAVFEAPNDFVHFIGHCDEAGLRCRDGALSTDDLGRSGAETFFLNACGSYHQGIDLVTGGSVAGAVTFEPVLDADAARVGTAFVRLLIDGFSIERALGLARRRIIMGTDYTVVGDGTHTLDGTADSVPLAVVVAPCEDGDDYRLTFDVSSPRVTGDARRLPGPIDERPRLFGAGSETTLSPTETRRFLERVDAPVVFDGDIRWPTDLAGRLDT
jgi:hypothetical protein